jgi:hypothetical protein
MLKPKILLFFITSIVSLTLTISLILHNYVFIQPTHPLLIPQDNKPYITVEYQGQMGNQIFQTAAAISFAMNNNCNIILPESFLSLSDLGIKSNCQRIFQKIPFRKLSTPPEYVYEQPPPFQYEPIPFNGSTKLKGFFESEQYFIKYKDLIIDVFSPPTQIERHLRQKFKAILSHPKTVGLHIRTLYYDQLNDKDLYNYYFPPDMEYIEKAINLFDEDCLFIVCSDFIPWCKKNLSHINRNFVFIENQKRHFDFYLLSLCKNMITSNSTFGWWAAYLNKNPDKKIIARSPWALSNERDYSGIYPKEWVVIEGNPHPPAPTFDFLQKNTHQ